MEKTRQYQFDRIEICRNCGGTGVVEKLGLLGHVLPKERTEACPVCEGTGRVRKLVEITVTVESFNSPAASGTPSQRGKG